MQCGKSALSRCNAGDASTHTWARHIGWRTGAQQRRDHLAVAAQRAAQERRRTTTRLRVGTRGEQRRDRVRVPVLARHAQGGSARGIGRLYIGPRGEEAAKARDAVVVRSGDERRVAWTWLATCGM